jgi:hypothetical protein
MYIKLGGEECLTETEEPGKGRREREDDEEVGEKSL